MFVTKIINTIILVIISYTLLKLIHFLLRRLFEFTRFDVRYENTLYSVLSSVSYYIVFVICIILILREFEMQNLLLVQLYWLLLLMIQTW